MERDRDRFPRLRAIPTALQPPNHYRLLGIPLFESDTEVIEVAAMRKIRFLREIEEGPHFLRAQQLLDDIAIARRCLLDATRKSAYDAGLRQRIEALGLAGQRDVWFRSP